MRKLLTAVAAVALAAGTAIVGSGVAFADDNDSYSSTHEYHYWRDSHSVHDDHSVRDDHANNSRSRSCYAGFIGVASCDDVPILSGILSSSDSSDES